MVVMDLHVVVRGIRYRPVNEGDSDVLQLIRKMKLVKHLELVG